MVIPRNVNNRSFLFVPITPRTLSRFLFLFLFLGLQAPITGLLPVVKANHLDGDVDISLTPPAEVYILRDFYNNMRGDQWTVSSWNIDGDPCMDAW